MRNNLARIEEAQHRAKAIELTVIGREIMHNSVQQRVDSNTIKLIRRKL